MLLGWWVEGGRNPPPILSQPSFLTHTQCPSLWLVFPQLPSHMQMATTGAAAIINTASQLQHAATDIEWMQDIVRDGVRNILETCLEKDVRVLVHTSAGERGSFGRALGIPCWRCCEV